jgi:hypothetical protein
MNERALNRPKDMKSKLQAAICRHWHWWDGFMWDEGLTATRRKFVDVYDDVNHHQTTGESNDWEWCK